MDHLSFFIETRTHILEKRFSIIEIKIKQNLCSIWLKCSRNHEFIISTSEPEVICELCEDLDVPKLTVDEDENLVFEEIKRVNTEGDLFNNEEYIESTKKNNRTIYNNVNSAYDLFSDVSFTSNKTKNCKRRRMIESEDENSDEEDLGNIASSSNTIIDSRTEIKVVTPEIPRKRLRRFIEIESEDEIEEIEEIVNREELDENIELRETYRNEILLSGDEASEFAENPRRYAENNSSSSDESSDDNLSDNEEERRDDRRNRDNRDDDPRYRLDGDPGRNCRFTGESMKNRALRIKDFYDLLDFEFVGRGTTDVSFRCPLCYKVTEFKTASLIYGCVCNDEDCLNDRWRIYFNHIMQRKGYTTNTDAPTRNTEIEITCNRTHRFFSKPSMIIYGHPCNICRNNNRNNEIY